MTKRANEFKIDAVLERIHHAMTADGQGFGELIFSITNIGDVINASEVSMAITFLGQSDKHPLPFPEGITTLKKLQSIAFNSTPSSLTRGSGAVIVLTMNTDGKEIARANVRDIP
ncbi:MAG: hypothetical protein NTZ39_05490 [Methanoregula sp.]|nr:hypothetical protein [Methanoregula sp.]